MGQHRAHLLQLLHKKMTSSDISSSFSLELTKHWITVSRDTDALERVKFVGKRGARIKLFCRLSVNVDKTIPKTISFMYISLLSINSAVV